MSTRVTFTAKILEALAPGRMGFDELHRRSGMNDRKRFSSLVAGLCRRKLVQVVSQQPHEVALVPIDDQPSHQRWTRGVPAGDRIDTAGLVPPREFVPYRMPAAFQRVVDTCVARRMPGRSRADEDFDGGS